MKVISLEDSIEPFTQRFNADRDQLRFVAIVSPT
jgi:hypothetical protein